MEDGRTGEGGKHLLNPKEEPLQQRRQSSRVTPDHS